jgi:DNA-binding GntR family transcriptional regulator
MPGRISRSWGASRLGVCSTTYTARVRRLRTAYETALVRELASGARPDGCATIEELHDAWQVGVARPAVSGPTFHAWQSLVDYQMNAVAALSRPAARAGRRPGQVPASSAAQPR